MMCAEFIIEPVLKYWNNESETMSIIKEIKTKKFDLNLLKKISFVCSNSNIYHQKTMLEFMLKDDTNSAYADNIASSLGIQNRVDLIESYCKKFDDFNDTQILKILKLISNTQDSEYYSFVAPLLKSKNCEIVDMAYETLVSIEAEEFF